MANNNADDGVDRRDGRWRVAGWRLRPFLFVAALLSLVSLAAPWISILTAGRIRLAITATVALISLIATFAATVAAVIVHKRRGLWVALMALPALFWPVFAASIRVACSIEDCD
jgi:hypothetical protein